MSSIFKAVYENNVESIKQFIRDADRTAPSLSRDSLSGSQGSRKKQIGSMTNINKRSILGRTALHLAAHWNRVEIVQLLIDCPHVNVNLRDRESGWTALHRALYAGHIESALVILARDDTDLSVKDFEGNTALDLYNSTINDTNPSPRILLPDTIHRNDRDRYSLTKSGILDWDENNGIAGGTELFTWGYNTNYVLGQRDSENRSRPDRVHLNLVSQQISQVLSRPEYVITSVTMSKFHSAVVTSEPDQNLLMCGFGGARLGLGNEDTQFLFKPVTGIHNRVDTVALGRDHTIVITSAGEVYSFGNNLHGQLGYETEKHQEQRIPQFTPRKIVAPSIKKEQIIGAAASSVHSAVYTETDLYTFGLNQGQLGYYATSGECDQVFPRKVSFLPPGARIIQAACIDTATMVLTASHDVFILFAHGHQKVIFPMQRFPPDFITYTAAPNYITRIMAGGDEFMGAMSNMGDLFIWTLPSRKVSTNVLKPRASSSTPMAEPQRSRTQILPRRIWALRKSHLTLSDASIGQDGSVIVCTTSGHVFLGTPRKVPKKNKNLVEKKLYKFIKVPYMQRCIMVTASPSGAYAALRAERSFKEVPVPDSTLASDLVMSLPHIRNAYHLQQSREAEALNEKILQEDRSKVPFLTEAVGLDLGQEAITICSSPWLEWDKYSGMTDTDYTVDAVIHVGDIRYYCHQIVLATRSRVFRNLLSSEKLGSNEKLKLHHKSGRTVQLDKNMNSSSQRGMVEINISDVHMETIWFFLDFVYSDRYDHPMNAFYGNAQRYTGKLKVITELQAHIKPEILQKELLFLSEVFQLPTLQDSVASSFNSQPRPLLASQFRGTYTDNISFSFFSDVKLELEDGELLCNELILRQRSPFFAALFNPAGIWMSSRRQENHSTITVNMNNISEKTMHIVLSYLYGDNRTTLFHDIEGPPELIFDLVSKVLEAADELMMDDLKVVCEAALLHLVTSRTILRALEIADDYRAEHVKQACIDLLAHNLDFYLETGYGTI
ncbi:regulator of chromosome condensation 1/beta-lactamase-inhibitor protein II [Umbelopsis sp. PMI_123]|nr:regulator of chromosome condensation 1/beta-lactamase-inhibitor protein II [Umbelopsis sp. PMI_123]